MCASGTSQTTPTGHRREALRCHARNACFGTAQVTNRRKKQCARHRQSRERTEYRNQTEPHFAVLDQVINKKSAVDRPRV